MSQKERETKTETKSIVLVGVGGQGILLASEILAQAAMLEGYEVKTNEVHGMAQRGGSVVAQVRYGPVGLQPTGGQRERPGAGGTGADRSSALC